MRSILVPALLLTACGGPAALEVATDTHGSRGTYTLTVVREGSGGGHVASNPAGIDCGRTCSATYAQGARVSLSAVSDPGSRFTGWGPSCTPDRIDPSRCELVVSANVSVTAGFTNPALDLYGAGGYPTPESPVAVGKIDASFSVDEAGQAVYSVPIHLPPGTLGVEPRLSLEYRSSGGNGLAGVGWSLRGLASIQRCPQTVAQDGQIVALSNGGGDRFCLNGRRLKSTSGSSGADGATYAPEVDDGARVTSHGDCGGGPCAFTAITKNGTVLELGHTPDSAVPSGLVAGVVREWAVNRITDTRGNYLTVEYDSDFDHVYPIAVRYTGNDAAPSEQRMLRRVDLEYEDRTDNELVFFGKNLRQLPRRLKTIRTTIITRDSRGAVREEPVKWYDLAYEYSYATRRSRLARITECGPENGGCLGYSTDFVYQDNDLAFGQDDLLDPGPLHRREWYHHGDFNGDGKTDTFVVINPSLAQPATIEVTLSGVNEGSPVSFAAPAATLQELECYGCFHRVYYFGDFDGDGRDDFLTHVNIIDPGKDRPAQIFRSNGDGTFAEWFAFTPDQHMDGNVRYYLGDYNGDGRTDVLASPNGHALREHLEAGGVTSALIACGWEGTIPGIGIGWKLFVSTGTGMAQSDHGSFPGITERFHTGDFNGDSRTDFLVTADYRVLAMIYGESLWGGTIDWTSGWAAVIWNGYHVYLADGPTFAYSHYQDDGWGYFEDLIPADFNGDGQTDFALVFSGAGHANNPLYWAGFRTIRSSNGSFLSGPSGSYSSLRPVVVDLNGDLRSDLAVGGSVLLSEGSSFWGVALPQPSGSFRPDIKATDFNGDGMSDLLIYFDTINGSPECTQYCQWGNSFVFRIASKGDRADLLAEVRDSIGGIVEIDYRPMTDDAVYQKTADYPYPNIAVETTQPLVSSYSLGAYVRGGSGGEITVSNQQEQQFRYQDVRVGLDGRGWLGFEVIDRFDLRLAAEGQATRHRTHFSRVFPFVGEIERAEIYSYPAGELLSDVENTFYPPQHLGTGRFRVELLRDVRRQHAGGVSQSLIKEYEYDLEGNVVRIWDRGGDGPADDFYVHTRYHNDATRRGYPLESWLSTDAAGLERLSHKLIEYDALMNVRSEKHWDNTHDVFRGVTSSHDVWGNPVWMEDPEGNVTYLAYDDFGFLRETTNPLGHVVTRTVDPRFGLESSTTDANGVTTRSLIDALGRIVELIGVDPDGVEVTMARYRLTKSPEVPGFVQQTFRRSEWEDEIYHWREVWKDPQGRETRVRSKGVDLKAVAVLKEYDLSGRMRRQSLEHYEGDAPEWVAYDYDIFNRPVQTTFPLAGVMHRLEYDDPQQKIIETTPSGEISEYLLDPRGRVLVRVKDGAPTSFDFDAIGRLQHVWDPASDSTTSISWDSLGRRTQITDSNFGTRSFFYTPAGNLYQETDGNNNVITRTWDALDRTLTRTVAGPNGSTETTYTYDDPASMHGTGRVSGVEHQRYDASHTAIGLGTRYDFDYDAYGRETVIAFTAGGRTYTSGKTYGPHGDAVELVYPDGSRLKSEYATNGRLAKLALRDPVVGPTFEDYAIFSDFAADGRPQSLEYKNGVVTNYSYYLPSQAGGHGLGAALQSVHTFRGATELQRYEYWWEAGTPAVDAIDDLLDPSYVQDFHYDSAGRLVAVQASYGARAFSYDDSGSYRGGNLTIMSNGTTSYVREFTAQRLTAEVWTDGTQSFSASFAYDANGNLIAKHKNGSSYTYSYDGDDHLLVVEKDALVTGRFEYDFRGNRVEKIDANGVRTLYVGSSYEITTHGADVLHTKYIEGPAGKLVAITHTESQVAAAIEQNTIDLGAAGFWLEVGRWAGPNAARELAIAAALTMVLAFLALFLLQLLRRASVAGGPVTGVMQRSLAWRAAVPVVFVSFVGTFGLGGCGAPVPSGTSTSALLVPGANGSGYAEVGTHYFHHSHVSSSALVTDAAGAQVARIEYEPFGRVNTSHSSGTDNFRYKFGGKEYDSDSELYYFGSRYYDPDLQRFITPDRGLGAHPLHHAALHRYAYASNNPVSFVDPSGRFAELALIAGVAAGVIIGALVAGTDGKIFTDPQNAFDDFNWEAAAVGAFAGAALTLLTFGLGSIGTPATGGTVLWGKPLGTYVQKALSSAILDTVGKWAHGLREGGRLGAYLGASFFRGLISSSGFFGVADSSVMTAFGGAITEQAGTSLLSSVMKAAAGEQDGLSISIWAFHVSFGKDTTFTGDWAFVGGQGVAFINNLLDGGIDSVVENFDQTSVILKTDGGQLELIANMLPKSYTKPDPVKLETVPAVLQKIASGVLDYTLPRVEPYLDVPFEVGPAARSGVSAGIDALAEELGPENSFFQK